MPQQSEPSAGDRRPDDLDAQHATSRRGVLAGLGATVGGFSLGLGPGESLLPAEFGIEQGGDCYPITPLSGDTPVEELYNWNTAESDYSAAGLTDLQRPNTSILFLYDGPNGLSFVVVHGQYGGDSAGGAASFDFEGLPEDGHWIVRDDQYDGSTNYDRWERNGSSAHVDWTWGDARTDGGAFRGLEGLRDLANEITITPAFNEAAALYGEYYEGKIADWQVLSGSLDDPDRRSLSMDEAVTIRRGGCPTNGTPLSDAGNGESTETDSGTERPTETETSAGTEDDEGLIDDDGGSEPPFDDDGKPGKGDGRGQGNGRGRGRESDRGRGGDDDEESVVSLIFGD